jgi:hypothetical protein
VPIKIELGTANESKIIYLAGSDDAGTNEDTVYCNNESDKSGLTVSDTINAGKFVLSTDVKYSDREAVQKQ